MQCDQQLVRCSKKMEPLILPKLYKTSDLNHILYQIGLPYLWHASPSGSINVADVSLTVLCLLQLSMV